MKVELYNLKTGEGVASNDIRALVSEVKNWVRQGMTSGALMIKKAPNRQVRKYFDDIANGERVTHCDLCGTHKKAKEMVFHCDQYDVCLVVECNDCHGRW